MENYGKICLYKAAEISAYSLNLWHVSVWLQRASQHWFGSFKSWWHYSFSAFRSELSFDFAEHTILLYQLERYISITSTVLKWFQSFLSNICFSVSLGAHSSSETDLTCGVPQGSILAPLLFSLYMSPLGSIMSRFSVSYHCYADDTQLYIPIQHKSMSSWT